MDFLFTYYDCSLYDFVSSVHDYDIILIVISRALNELQQVMDMCQIFVIYSNLVTYLSEYVLMYTVKLIHLLLIHKSERDKFCS